MKLFIDIIADTGKNLLLQNIFVCTLMMREQRGAVTLMDPLDADGHGDDYIL